MLHIDFYILAISTSEARYQFACDLIEKVYQKNNSCYIHLPSETAAHEFDELLWTFRANSFIPHNVFTDMPTLSSPVQIGYQVTPTQLPPQLEILVNLTQDIPTFCSSFRRLVEIIIPSEDALNNARAHYRHYRQQGFTLNYHDLRQS